MSRKNTHYDNLARLAREVANKYSLDYVKFSPYHMRISDGGYTVLDLWTTAKYYVKETSYYEAYAESGLIERGGETGLLPVKKLELDMWIRELFFPSRAVDI